MGFSFVYEFNFILYIFFFYVCVVKWQQHQRIPHPFPHLSLPPPTDGMLDTMTMTPNAVATLQQKQHHTFIPPPTQNKYAHMHNVSGFIYKILHLITRMEKKNNRNNIHTQQRKQSKIKTLNNDKFKTFNNRLQ